MKNLLVLPFICIAIVFGLGLSEDFIPRQKNTGIPTPLEIRSASEAKGLQGAWSAHETNESGEKITITAIIIDGYMAKTFYNEKTNEFVRTNGGSWAVKGDVFSFTTEFSSSDSSTVGTTTDIFFNLEKDKLSFAGSDKIWHRIDHGTEGDLNGAWLITGRERDGNLRRRTPGARKTMKILSETRFQWIAYNTDTGGFFGTGGGTYTAKDSTYTENIAFFSRDDSRVGAKLSFSYKIVENEWHHRGLSSKGNPIYEIWSPRIMASKTID